MQWDELKLWQHDQVCEIRSSSENGTLRSWIVDGIGYDREICPQKVDGSIETKSLTPNQEIMYEEISRKIFDIQDDRFNTDLSCIRIYEDIEGSLHFSFKRVRNVISRSMYLKQIMLRVLRYWVISMW